MSFFSAPLSAEGEDTTSLSVRLQACVSLTAALNFLTHKQSLPACHSTLGLTVKCYCVFPF